MLTNHYVCGTCREEFHFSFRHACYHVGVSPIDKSVADTALISVPVRPAWCKDCGILAVAEDIAPLRAFEDAYGAVRGGRIVEYPVETDGLDSTEAEKEVGRHLRWRMGRRRAARVLCCGGSNYQWMDVERPLLKHAECEFGFIQSVFVISSFCGPRPGTLSPADVRLFDPEGELIGLLTWRDRDQGAWEVEPARYPPAVDQPTL